MVNIVDDPCCFVSRLHLTEAVRAFGPAVLKVGSDQTSASERGPPAPGHALMTICWYHLVHTLTFIGLTGVHLDVDMSL